MADSALVARIMTALHAKWTNIPASDTNGGLSILADLIACGWGSNVKSLNGAGYTVLDNDHFTFVITINGAGNYDDTLPASANNQGRILGFIKVDSGAGYVRLLPNGADTFENGATALYVSKQYQSVGFICFGAVWYRLWGALQPVPGEPSMGTPHIIGDANRAASTLVSTAVNTSGVWSAAVSAPAGAPMGAKAMWCLCECTIASAGAALCVEAATGYTLSDVSVGNNRAKYWGVETSIANHRASGIIKIHLDSNKQFKWCTFYTSSTVAIYYPIDYEM